MMSEHFAHTQNDCDGNSRQSTHSYHSDWMSHWTRRNNKDSDHASLDYPLTSRKETASSACSPARGIAGIKPGCSKMKNKGLRMSSTIAGKETRRFQPGPMGDSNGESTSNTRDSHAASDFGALIVHQNKQYPDFNSTSLSLKCHTATPLPVAPGADLNPSKDGHFEAEGMSNNSKQHVKTYPSLGDSSFTILRPLSEDLNVSSTKMVQHGSGNVNKLLSIFRSRVGTSALAPEAQLSVINPSFEDSDKMNCQRHSTLMACDHKLECLSKSVRSLTSHQQQKILSSSESDPCKVNSHFPEASQHKFQERHNAYGFRILWNQSHHSVVAKSGNLHAACNSAPEFTDSHQDLESMRICRTNLDSVVGLPKGQPRYSVKNAKGTDFGSYRSKESLRNSYRSKESLRNLRESAETSRNVFLQFCGMPCLGIVRQGVKIESLSSSSDSEGKEIVGDHYDKSNDIELGKAFDDSASCKGKQVMDDRDQKSESTAETDTVNLDNFRGKKRLGVNSSGAIEFLKLGLGTLHFSVTSASLLKQKDHKLSVNKTQFPGLPAANNGDASSSRTQSPDIQTNSIHSRSDQCPGGSSLLEPASRWIKRLRLSDSELHSFGTKHSTMEELSSRDKRSPRKSRKRLLSRSESTINDFQGKVGLVRCSDSSSVEKTQKEGRLALTSQSWIRRWFQNQSPTQQKKPEGIVYCEPQRSKLAFDDLQERQLPSVGAMALVGKAMRGVQPCDLQKKGPVIVWNVRNSKT